MSSKSRDKWSLIAEINGSVQNNDFQNFLETKIVAEGYVQQTSIEDFQQAT